SALQVGFVAEQDGMVHIAQLVLLNQTSELIQNPFATDAVNHAEQVVGPVWQASWALVTECDTGGGCHGIAERRNPIVRYVPDHHGVSPIAQGAMLDYQSQAFDQALLLPLADSVHNLLFGQPGAFGQGLIGARCQRQAVFQLLAQPQQAPGTHGFGIKQIAVVRAGGWQVHGNASQSMSKPRSIW